MAKKKTELDKAAEKLATIILAQLDTLPPDVAKAKRKEFHQMAVRASRAAKTGKPSRLRRNAVIRPSTRSRAKTA